jgi:hypothetical protein
MKPLLRWTIGNVAKAGYETLKYSIKTVKSIYGDKFDLFLCHNSIEESSLQFAKDYGVKLINQDSTCLPSSPKGVAWKLYPPRLSLESHEIMVDNDLVILKQLPEIDKFLTSNSVIYTEGLFGLYGSFKKTVTIKPYLNSGLIGLPPNFDFATAILKNIKPWEDYFDEQGLIAKIFSTFPNKICIKLPTIAICRQDGILPNFTHGCHFCGVNRTEARAWKTFKRRILI